MVTAVIRCGSSCARSAVRATFSPFRSSRPLRRMWTTSMPMHPASANASACTGEGPAFPPLSSTIDASADVPLKTRSCSQISSSVIAGCADHAGPQTSPNAASRAGIREASVRAHLEFLASDALNGRASGSRDEQIAAEYVGAQFRRLGFKPGGTAGSFVQTVEMTRLTATAKPSIAIGSAVKWTYGKEFVAGNLGAPSVSGPLYRVQGSAASVPRGSVAFMAEENQDLMAQVVLAGPRAILVRRNLTPAQWEAQAARTPTFALVITGVPSGSRPMVISLSADAATALAAVAAGTEVRIDTPVGDPQKAYTYNAVGILQGTSPSGEAILITSHLDHLGRRDNAPGADALADRLRPLGPGINAGEARRQAGPGPASGDELLPTIRQLHARAARGRRAHGVEL